MASTDRVQSILRALTLVQNTEMSEEQMESTGVLEMLAEMDDIGDELISVLG